MAERKIRHIEFHDVVGVSTIRAEVGELVIGHPSEEGPDDRHERSAWWLVKRAVRWVLGRSLWEMLSNLPFLRKRMA